MPDYHLSPFEPNFGRIHVEGQKLADQYAPLSLLEIAQLEDIDLLLRERMPDCDSVHAFVSGRWVVTLDSTYTEHDLRVILCKELIRLRITKEQQSFGKN
jgi:hypothetical protein